MDDRGCGKVTGIRQIVRLKEIIQKWQTASSRPSAPRSGGDCPGSVSRPINKRLKNVMYCDSDEESCASPEPPPDVPKGYLAVYVGPELRRFIIPTSYLTHPVFKILLEKAEEEFGYDHNGGLTLPCEIETFKYLLQCIENHPKGYLVESLVSKQVGYGCRFYVNPWVHFPNNGVPFAAGDSLSNCCAGLNCGVKTRSLSICRQISFFFKCLVLSV